MCRGILLLFSGRVPSCYSNQDLDYRVLRSCSRTAFDAPGTASYLLLYSKQRRVGTGLQRAPFSERADSAGEL